MCIVAFKAIGKKSHIGIMQICMGDCTERKSIAQLNRIGNCDTERETLNLTSQISACDHGPAPIVIQPIRRQSVSNKSPQPEGSNMESANRNAAVITQYMRMILRL